MLDQAVTGATILVVDDAPPNVKLLRLILKDAGYRVLEATNGPDALETLRREKPDALVLDVRMPGMTGYDVCREIRHDPEFAFLPVIMVTALSMPEDRIAGIEAGATDFITKPFNKKELLARLRASLDAAQSCRSGILTQLPGAVVVADPDWKILGVSPQAATLLGILPPGIAELSFVGLLGPAEQERVAADRTLTEFPLRIPTTRLLLDARQQLVTDPTGRLLLRVISLSPAANDPLQGR